MKMSKNRDPLLDLSVDKWNNLKQEFVSDWPRGITGYYALDTLSRWLTLGQDYGFKIFNPFGEARNGMIAILKDETDFSEMLIECPQDETSILANAIKGTNLIDWKKDIVILFLRIHVVNCIKRIAEDIGTEVAWVHTLKLYVLSKDSSLFDVCPPQGFTFQLLTEDCIELVDSKWPHRYPGSSKYFQLLIRSKSGYGLYKDGELVSWGFVKELGALGHLFTLEEHRRKGYGQITIKLICNELLKKGNDVFSFCLVDNVESCKMHEKIGFLEADEVYSVKLKCSKSNEFK